MYSLASLYLSAKEKLLLFHLNKSTHLSSRTNQAPFKCYISIFPQAWRIFLQSNPTILIVFHLFLACFQLNMIIPPQQINIYVLPHKSGSVQVLHLHLSPGSSSASFWATEMLFRWKLLRPHSLTSVNCTKKGDPEITVAHWRFSNFLLIFLMIG